ncbi:MAG: N-acetyl sugar amidotransferase, partial [Fluviicola sp.]
MSQVMQICNRCVMDSSDPTIHFDEKGNCNHCNDLIHLLVDQSENGLHSITQKIKSKKTHPTYDCILGISGGVDSCYTAYLLKKEGLNPLLVHLNNGWNTPISN